MKVLLQDRQTSRYVAPDDCWSEQPEAARVFSDLAEARRYGQKRKHPELRIVALAGREHSSIVDRRPGGPA